MRRRALIALAIGACLAAVLSPSTAAAASACAPWTGHTIVDGHGWLENLAFDGRGSITVSALQENTLLRVSRRGRVSTLLRSVESPGAQVRRGRFLFFNTGDGTATGPTGTIGRLDLKTGRRSTWARGLVSPNGLAFLPNGDAVASRTSGPQITRVRARDKRLQVGWATVQGANGLALAPSRRDLYVARTFSPAGQIDRVSIAHPNRVRTVGSLGAGVLPDDLTVGPGGRLYVAGFGSGKVYRLNPRTGATCAIASGLKQPTSVRFGGPGWPSGRLYVTAAGGQLSELVPPRR